MSIYLGYILSIRGVGAITFRGLFTFDKSVVLCGAPALDLAHGNAPVQQVGPVREHTPPCGGPVTCGEREVCTPILERRALTLVGVVVVVVAAARGVCVPVLHLT